MADQRSTFRFRLPWLPAASAPRPAAPRPPAQPTPAPRRAPETQVPSQPSTTATATTTAPSPGQQPTASPTTPTTTPVAPRRAPEVQAPSQPTSITTAPSPGQQSTARTTTPTPTPAAPRRAPETQVPSQPTSTTAIPSPGQQSTATTPSPATTQRTIEKQVPSQPKSTTTPVTSQYTNGTTATPQIQSPTKGMPPSSATSKKDETEAPSASIPDKAASVPEKEKTITDQTQLPSQSTAPRAPTTADTQTPQAQPSSQPTTTDTSERPQIKPPGATSPQASLPQPQGSRTESQPSSPARLPQSRAASRPPSPSHATNQSRTSQPSTPPHAASQSRATSVLSSPSRRESPKSPVPRTNSQPTSQPRTPSRPVAGQIPTTSPPTKVAVGQPTAATHAESTSPSKGERRPTTSVQDREPKSIISAQQPTEQLQPKEETKSGITYESQTQTPVKTSTDSNGIAQQPLKESSKETTTKSATPTGTPQTSTHTKKSDTPIRNGKPESFPQDSKPEETKEVKEIMQETEKKAKDEALEKDDYNLTRDLAPAEQTKEQLSFISQPEKEQQAVEQKEVKHRPVSNGKESKTTAQPRNKIVSVESRQRLPMTNGEHIPLHKEIRGDISKLVKNMATGHPAQTTNEKPVSVITLAGENRGATMQLGTDSMKRGSPVPIRRGYKVNPDESVETSTDGEGRSDDTKDTEDQAPEAFINSNIQGINNSIIFNGSITERNSGVRLVHSRFPIKYKKSMEEFPGKEKIEFTATHALRPIYQPMVKRRCLRGLFLESSDSDPENTTKPRRHGCRVGCKEKS